MIKIEVHSTRAVIRYQEPLTVGLRGAKVRFSFGTPWEGLIKTAVFRQGEKTVAVADVGDEATIPGEVLMTPGMPVQIGVYGRDSAGTVVIPTVWATTQPVRPGTDPEGDPSTEPTPGLWEQMQGKMGSLEQLETVEKTSLVGAINEANRAVFAVTVSGPDEAFSADRSVIELAAAQAAGKTLLCFWEKHGLWLQLHYIREMANGRSVADFRGIAENVAYRVYMMSTAEGETAAIGEVMTLATEDSKLPNPKKLLLDGAQRVEYDGSEEMEVHIPSKTSQLTNDSGFLTAAPVTGVNGQTGDVTLPTVVKVTLKKLSDGKYLPSMSLAKMIEAHDAGNAVYCQYNDVALPLVSGSPNACVFTCVCSGKVYTVDVADDFVATVSEVPLASGSGTDGITPHIGENGNWFIGETDTGVPSRGEDGVSPNVTVSRFEGDGGSGATIWVDYPDGTSSGTFVDDGVSVTHKWDGTVLKVTSASGTSSADLKGEPGKDGSDGADYVLTDEDLEEIATLAAMKIREEALLGTVDDSNNILLSGSLADGTYILKYENADGTYAEIGTLKVGAEDIPAYTNLADPTSADWQEGYRLSLSSGGTSALAGHTTTNYIPCKRGDVLRVKGLNIVGYLADGATESPNAAKIVTYDSSKTKLSGLYGITLTGNNSAYASKVTTSGDVSTYTILRDNDDVQCTTSECAYVRIDGELMDGYTAEDVIITVNEEIV